MLNKENPENSTASEVVSQEDVSKVEALKPDTIRKGDNVVTISVDLEKPETIVVNNASKTNIENNHENPLLQVNYTAILVFFKVIAFFVQETAANVLTQQFYQLPLDVVQELDVNQITNEPILQASITDPTQSQVSVYINYDDLQTFNTNIYGNLLSQIPQIKLQVSLEVSRFPLEVISLISRMTPCF